jgi:hypothetical protein
MAKKDETTAEVTAAAEAQYSKAQLLTSKKYAHRRDLIGALLVDGKLYTISKVDGLIKDFDERKM